MSEKLNGTQRERWVRVLALSVFLLMMFFMVRQINYFLWDSVWNTFYVLIIPVIAAFFLYFGGLGYGLEVKLLFCFWLWYFISRILNGGETLVHDFNSVRNYIMFFLCGAVGMALKPEQRERAMKWTCGCMAAYYTVLAVISIVCSLLRITVINPLTEGNICKMGTKDFSRLALLDTNPNITAVWFFIAAFTLVYLFFRCRHKLWRIPIVIAVVLNYLALTLTYCRNMKVGFSVCTAMLLMLLALRYIPLRKVWQKAAVLACIAVITIPLCYKSFDGAAELLARASDAVTAEEAAPAESSQETPAPPAAETGPVAAALPESTGAEDESVENAFTDPRDFAKSVRTLSDRTQIFESAFITLKQEPIRLLRGCRSDLIMSIAMPILELHNVHFHNFALQVLVYTGLPGFILAVAYCVLLLIRMIRFFFSEDPKAAFPEKMLTLILAGLLLYNMLEPLLFFEMDFSTLYFYFIAGIFLGCSYDVHPPKPRAKKG